MRVRNRRLAWLISLAITAGLFLFIALFLDWRYSQNDDISILRSFMGYETGEPAHFQIFIHGLLAWPIYWLAKAFPTVAWFSIVQIALLCLSCWMIFKSVMQCFVNRDKPLWMGVVGALALAAVFLELCTQITFTLTAGLLGAAAVAQVLSIDAEKSGFRQTALGVMGALPPTAFAYALRKESAVARAGISDGRAFGGVAVAGAGRPQGAQKGAAARFGGLCPRHRGSVGLAGH